jgi:hypothetical protein
VSPGGGSDGLHWSDRPVPAPTTWQPSTEEERDAAVRRYWAAVDEEGRVRQYVQQHAPVLRSVVWIARVALTALVLSTLALVVAVYAAVAN